MERKSLAKRMSSGESRRFIAFLVTGGVAALVNILSRLVFGLVLPFASAVTLAYLVGMTTAFLLARMFVFSSSGRSLHVEYGRFALVNVAALLQVLTVSLVLATLVFPAIGLLWNAETVAHVIGVLSPVAVSYQGHKRFSFA